MYSHAPYIMSPEEEIITFKQESEESFRDAWSRIFESYGKTEPKMTLSLLLNSFYFGLVLCYRYALDAVVGGDFHRHDGDQAFNAIKKLIAASTVSNSKIDSAIENIDARLNTLESDISSLKEDYNQVHMHDENVPFNFEPLGWVPSVKIAINGEIFHARCDIRSEFCLMPMNIYDSLSLWGLSKSEAFIILADNSIKMPMGIDEGVFTKLMRMTVSIDYHVIECAGKGHITLGRSLLKLLGAVIDMNHGILRISSPNGKHTFPKVKVKKRSKRSKGNNVDVSSLDNT